MVAALSKKQQKALAFRSKRKGTKKQDDDVLDVPEPDLDDGAPLDPAREQTPPTPTQPAPLTGKRKRSEPDVHDEQEKPPKKKTKASADGAGDADADADAESTTQKQNPKFILFLGNLKYTTTQEQIAQHFSACNPPPNIRLLTPKVVPGQPAKPTIKSRGCAFLEFKSHNTLQQGLKLHNSTLDGRQINVELTAGGGGKSAGRLDKVRQRNKALGQERKKRLVKSGKATEEQAESEVAKPQRHSGTSGEERAVAPRKTWSVPDGDEAAGRGGKKHAKKQRGPKQAKWAPSGANAIAVG
ncbi:hypothetical protein BKA62DRAFT_227492 [Auriculariales sp. MPI-PUGE-AT-0066]|nr:hypothetical protein BKA62DRAFT_227492 [Auriculariales sp. MPI-PUGE-AT-0066]